MRDLARNLSKLKGDRYLGALIIEAVWRRESHGEPREMPRLLCRSRRFLTAETWSRSESLAVTMLLGCGSKAVCRAVPPHGHLPDAEDIWRIFSTEEISEFIKQTGDTNPLHQGARPVVPGLLILESLLTEEGFLGCSIVRVKFRQAAFAGDPLRLSASNGRFSIRSGELLLCDGQKSCI